MTVTAEDCADDPSHDALRRRRATRWLSFGVVGSVVAVADQVTKAWIDASYPLGTASPVIGDLVRITKHYNDGGIFGLLGDSALILGIGSLAVIAFIVFYQARHGVVEGPLLSLALGLLMGGAVGNLIDRFRHGYVIDFVDMGIGDLRWYSYNVADAAISTAIVLLIALSIFGARIPGMGSARGDP